MNVFVNPFNIPVLVQRHINSHQVECFLFHLGISGQFVPQSCDKTSEGILLFSLSPTVINMQLVFECSYHAKCGFAFIFKVVSGFC